MFIKNRVFGDFRLDGRARRDYRYFEIETEIVSISICDFCVLLLTDVKELISGRCIEILDLECVLCHVTGVQNENKNALINPPSWIFPRSVVYKMSWGEFNLPL